MKRLEASDGTIFLQALPGEEIVAALTEYVNEKRIYAGSVQAIGAVSEAEIGHFDPKEMKYAKKTLPGPLEILSLSGNFARTEDGKAFLHAHIVLGERDLSVRGGHLFRAVAEPTCEIILRPSPAVVERRFVPEAGLKLWRLG